LGLYSTPPDCSQYYYYCAPPPACGVDDPNCNGCDPFDPYCPGSPGGGGSGGGGGSAPVGNPPAPPQRKGGVWPDNETLGLPRGLNLHPATLADLLGLSPGTHCDFGVCAPIGNGFVAGVDDAIEVGAVVRGIWFLVFLYQALHAPTHASDAPLTPHHYEICHPDHVEVHADLGLKACYYKCDSDGSVHLGEAVNLDESCPTYWIRQKP
jgi:hypothetical protein